MGAQLRQALQHRYRGRLAGLMYFRSRTTLWFCVGGIFGTGLSG